MGATVVAPRSERIPGPVSAKLSADASSGRPSVDGSRHTAPEDRDAPSYTGGRGLIEPGPRTDAARRELLAEAHVKELLLDEEVDGGLRPARARFAGSVPGRLCGARRREQRAQCLWWSHGITSEGRGAGGA